MAERKICNAKLNRRTKGEFATEIKPKMDSERISPKAVDDPLGSYEPPAKNNDLTKE